MLPIYFLSSFSSSNSKLFVCICIGPSLPPQNLRSYVLGPRSASISWLPPSIEGQNGIILYYILLLVDDQLSTDDRAINTALTSHSFSDLEEYNIYNYSTAAATGVGVGVFSPPVQFTTHEDGSYTMN